MPSHNLEKPQPQHVQALRDAQKNAIAALQKTGLSVAVAESCTGGLLAKTLTDAAGSSAWFDSGIVTYSNQAKQQFLNVPSQLIDNHGAVSEAVASAMAAGMLTASAANITAGITGIAGPSGGSAEKPVGTVCIATASASLQTVKTYQYQGSRAEIRIQSATTALQLLEQQSQNFL